MKSSGFDLFAEHAFPRHGRNDFSEFRAIAPEGNKTANDNPSTPLPSTVVITRGRPGDGDDDWDDRDRRGRDDDD